MKLKPLDVFFFGNERTFGYKNEEKNYLVKSNPFPQQTAILGMIRKEILIRKGKLKHNWDYSEKDREEIKELIGEESFDISIKDEQNFGMIKSISPVFLCEGDKYFIQAPMDHTLSKGKEYKQYEPFKEFEKVKTSFGEVKIPLAFDTKEGVINGFMEIGEKNIVKFDKIFKVDERIGIKKNRKGKTEEDAFYKINYYKLTGDYVFSFLLEMNEEIEMKDTIVYLGAEKSAFKMTVEEIEKTLSEYVYLKNDKKDKIILLSDTYLPEDVYEYCDYAITKSIDFRNIKTNRTNKKHSDDNNRFEKVETKYGFFKKGSVLYPSEYELLMKKIEEHKNLRKIGYNMVL